MGYLIFRDINEDIIDAFCAALLWDEGKRKEAVSILKKKENNFCRCVVKELDLSESGVDIEIRNELLTIFLVKMSRDLLFVGERNLFLMP